MIRPAFVWMTLLILTGLVGGCYESEFPLDPVPQVQTDSRVMGSWRCVSPDASDEAITLTVAPSQVPRYAITWQESGRPPDRFEGYASSLMGTTLVNVRDLNERVPPSTANPWRFINYTLLQPNVLYIRVVHERLLKGSAQSREAIRNTIERERLNPALYEDLIACIRTRT
jgi:hypothetical protein